MVLSTPGYYPCASSELSFFKSTTYDNTGKTWTATGSPTLTTTSPWIYQALNLTGTQYLKRSDSFVFYGQPFTIDCIYARTSVDTARTIPLVQFWKSTYLRFQISFPKDSTLQFWGCKSSSTADTISNFRTTDNTPSDGNIHWVRINHVDGVWRMFFDGAYLGKYELAFPDTTFSVFVGYSGVNSSGNWFKGRIHWFRLTEGCPMEGENDLGNDWATNKLAATRLVNLNFSTDIYTDSYYQVWDYLRNATNTTLPTVSKTNAASGKALQLAGQHGIMCCNFVRLGGRDFTVSCWVTINSSCANKAHFVMITPIDSSNNARVKILSGSSSGKIAIIHDYTANGLEFSCTWGTKHHIGIVYIYSQDRFTVYLDGKTMATVTGTLFTTSQPFNMTIGHNTDNTIGTLDSLEIFSGYAIWTDVTLNTTIFTPSAYILA